MLRISEDAASERRGQICRSALAMGRASGNGSIRPVTVGITESSAGSNFGMTVSRAVELANQGLDDGKDAISVEVQAAAAL